MDGPDGPDAGALSAESAIAVTVMELPAAVAATGAPLVLNAAARAEGRAESVVPPL